MSFSTLSTLSKPSLLQKFQLAWPWPFPNLHLHLLPKSLPFWLGGYCRNSSEFKVMKAWMQVQVDTVDTRIMSDCCQSCKLIPSGIAAATSCRETVILVSLVYHLYLKRLSCLPTSRRRHKDSSLRLTMALLWQLNLSHAARCKPSNSDAKVSVWASAGSQQGSQLDRACLHVFFSST